MPDSDMMFEKFMALISPGAPKREVECAKYLAHAGPRLFPRFPHRELTFSFEERMHFGDSDYIVAGDFKTDVGKIERRVYLWELKAAQCFLMQRDDNNTRLRPTVDLIKAETQLIHYATEAKSNEMFCRKFDVRPHNVMMGGIIIGRDERIWDPEDKRVTQMDGHLSYDLRREKIYDMTGIAIMTWDRIADFLKPDVQPKPSAEKAGSPTSPPPSLAISNT